MHFIREDHRFSDHDPIARSGAPYSGIHWPRPPRLPKTTTREPEKPKPKVPVPIVQPLYAMPRETPIREGRGYFKDCSIHTYTLIKDKGVKKAKYEKHPVKYIGSNLKALHFRIFYYPPHRYFHFLELTPKDINTFMKMNEGAPIFCDGAFAFVCTRPGEGNTVVALSIRDNDKQIDIIKQKYPTRAKLPIYRSS